MTPFLTSANVHDSQPLRDLVDDKDRELYADAAYDGNNVHKELPPELKLQITEKACRHKKLTEEQKKNNRIKSKVRCRVEHIFGFVNTSMKGLAVRSIGLARATFSVGLSNLIYNIYRYEFLRRPTVSVG